MYPVGNIISEDLTVFGCSNIHPFYQSLPQYLIKFYTRIMTSNGHSNGSSTYTVPLQINGEEVKTEEIFDGVSPATGKVLWKGASASKEDAIKAVKAAQAAFPARSRIQPSYGGTSS